MILFYFILFYFIYREGYIQARTKGGDRLLLYLGVIDILQSYRLKKRLEHGLKSIITDGVMGEWEWENRNGGMGMGE